MVKNIKTLQKKKKKYKAFFKDKNGIFIIGKLTRLRKKLGYNHDDIMVREETSIAEKIMKFFLMKYCT